MQDNVIGDVDVLAERYRNDNSVNNNKLVIISRESVNSGCVEFLIPSSIWKWKKLENMPECTNSFALVPVLAWQLQYRHFCLYYYVDKSFHWYSWWRLEHRFARFHSDGRIKRSLCRRRTSVFIMTEIESPYKTEWD